ncbi:DUF2461 domain-containing protein [Portibacter lacus]|uniref:TIGR02453 family protein n=1 Tax=Portibacter lacus TaxID=1099794 RepID=A0AA37SRY8_9BACT|nr:DUF2461 domain-containing protein [Portibacter lacus]GLR18655.1 TIGR02453 family protein [Portibacter lacus]
MITEKTFKFLKELKQNNNRDWFQNNKSLYETSQLEMIDLAKNVNELMSTHDHIVELSPKRSIFRIYRDVRFSKDKTPYKTNWGGRVKRDTPFLRGGYYYQVEPGNSFAAVGFWGPSSPDLKLIRKQIAQDPEGIIQVSKDPGIIATFGEINGERLKKAPQGFSPDHEAIHWLRYKQFILSKSFTDKEVLGSDFAEKLDKTFRTARPFLNYMSEILTTNLDGEPLYE